MSEIIKAPERAIIENWRLLEEDVTIHDREIAQRMLVPKMFLHGTQVKNSYIRNTEKWFKQVQQTKEGLLELLRNPIVVVAIHEPNGIGLHISDGHHRARYGIRGIVPSLIFSEDQALAIINRGNSHRLSLDQYRDFMHRMADQAVASFSSSLPTEKYPKLTPGVENVKELRSVPGFKPY